MKTNIRIKKYNGIISEITICDKNVYESEPRLNVEGATHSDTAPHTPQDGAERSENEEVRLVSDRGRRRAAKRVFDLIACNPELDLFCTFTLDARRIDRYDYAVIVRKLNTWLDNHVRRRGLKYIMVAEHHKDGAIHFHALCNRALDMVDSGHTDKNGHTVYNLPEWAYGFSTAIECYGEREHCCKYVVKYITKGHDRVGGRWFYHGGTLNQPSFEYARVSLVDEDECSLCAEDAAVSAERPDVMYERDCVTAMCARVIKSNGGGDVRVNRFVVSDGFLAGTTFIHITPERGCG